MNAELILANQSDISPIETLLYSDEKISVAIREDIPPEQLISMLDSGARTLGRLQDMIYRLKPIVGQMLIIIQNKPESYRSMGYETFDKFVKERVEDALGLSRTEAYFAMRIVKKFPGLTLGQYERIGPSRLDLIGRVMDGSAGNVEPWLQLAESGGQNGKPLPLRDLKKAMVTSGLREPGQDDFDTIVISCNKAVSSRWKEFLATPVVVQFCGSDKPTMILDMMIQECLASWTPQVQEAENELTKGLELDIP